LQINSLFKRAFKYVYVKCVIKLEQLLQDYDDKLFTKAAQGNHAMRSSATASQSQVYFLLGLGLTYEHSTMAGLLIWLNLNY